MTTPSKESNNEPFWLNDPSVLYKDNNYLVFFPTYSMTRVEQLNAITRFCIFLIILILAFDRGQAILVIPITIVIIVILFYKLNVVDRQEKVQEKVQDLANNLQTRNETEQFNNKLKSQSIPQDGDVVYKTVDDIQRADGQNKDYILKSGSYDSDGYLHLGTKENPSNYLRGDTPSLYTPDQLQQYEKNTCRRPTVNNPLMNPAAVEFGQENIPAACNSEDSEIKENIKIVFNNNLFKNVGENYTIDAVSRQFYTMPNTAVPSPQVEFANWLYHVSDSSICKVDGSACLRYYDLRSRTR